MIVLVIVFRLLSLIGKEVVETFRRPGAALSLVVGPFIILALFGFGYDSVRQPLRAVVVVPPSSGLPTDQASWDRYDTSEIDVVGVTASEGDARSQLQAGGADILVIAPADAAATFEAGQQSVIRVEYAEVDPIRADVARVAANQIATEVNRQIITRAVEQGQDRSYGLGDPRIADASGRVPAEVVAEPTRAEAVNLSPTSPDVVAFYGPAAIALILQHMALTLVAMSLVRERTSGVIELFRISPVSASEVVAGKVLSFSGLVALVAVVTLGVLMVGLGVPMLAGAGPTVTVVGALIAASLGLGLLVGLVSDSERQAVQLSMLVLLASVFFSGLVAPLGAFAPPVQAIAYLLPATHAMALLQDLLLTGTTRAWWQLGALFAIAGVGLVLGWALLRRRMSRI